VHDRQQKRSPFCSFSIDISKVPGDGSRNEAAKPLGRRTALGKGDPAFRAPTSASSSAEARSARK
jgi:hypothetical protein